MAKRRKRPAPPLILTPTFGRHPQGGSRAGLLVELARFLQGRNLLTDGGVKSLEQGLTGRNCVVSLGLQDVRSYAHGLVQELIARPSSQWPACMETYFQTYDKGKPRRPTHLQRLYLDWSRDLSWPGLLRACQDHPHLWNELDLALERLNDDSHEKDMLNLALACRNDMGLWESAFAAQDAQKKSLLVMLGLLTPQCVSWRLHWLAEVASSCSGEEDWTVALVEACHCNFAQARQLRSETLDRGSLERVALTCLDQEQFHPMFVSSFRSFVQSAQTIESLFEAIPASDPLRSAVYGARPGTSWLTAQKEEMHRLIELR